MAEKKTSLKNQQRAAALGCTPTGTVIGSRITQLSDLDTDLSALADMSLAAMRARWQEVSDKPVPRVRRTLLRLALAYELQTAVHGGLSRRTEQRLAYLAGRNSAPNAPRHGMRRCCQSNLNSSPIGGERPT